MSGSGADCRATVHSDDPDDYDVSLDVGAVSPTISPTNHA